MTRLDDLADAVRLMAAGGSVIDPEVVARLLGGPWRHSPLDELTPREREILGPMAEGRSNQGIAARLVLELKGVEAASARSSRSSTSSRRARTTAASSRSSGT